MLSTAQNLNPNIFAKTVDKLSNRAGFGESVLTAGNQNPNIVVLTADLTESTKVDGFKAKFPERFIQIGVAEQNMAGIAAGLALAGKIPFMTSYGVFSPGRNWDQIRISICYSNANVKIIGSHGGIAAGPDGATHQALEDIAITRVLPNMTVLVPADYLEAKKATLAAANHLGPVYIRLTREETPQITTEQTPFEIGKAEVWIEGKDAVIIACGPIIYEALLAAKTLKDQHNLFCGVINCATIKPLDKETILQATKDVPLVVTLEDHQIIGGLGSTVAELLSENQPTKLIRMGIYDTFGESGTPQELREKYGLTSNIIAQKISGMLQ